MIPEIGITIDVAKVIEHLDFADKQVRFALARALNDVTWIAAKQAQGKMPQQFTLRSQWYVKGLRGAGRTGGQRATRDNLTASVVHLDEHMALQQFGGTKTAVSGTHIAMPGPRDHGIRIGPDMLRPRGGSKDPKSIKKRNWPSTLLATARGNRHFVNSFKSGATFLAQRESGLEKAKPRLRKAWTTAKRRNERGIFVRKDVRLKRTFKVRYVLVNRARVKSRLHLDVTTQEAMAAFRQLFWVHYENAVRTARPVVEWSQV